MERKSEKRENEDLEGHTLVLPRTIRVCRYSEFWTISSALTIPVSDLVIRSTYLSRASIAFQCPHRGHPLTFWMKNDRLLVNQVKTAVNLDGSLIIIEAEMRHEGKYTCSVATPQGVAMRSAKLEIVERKGTLQTQIICYTYVMHCV